MSFIAPEACVHPGAVIGEGAQIQAFAFLDEGVCVGERSVVGQGAVLLSGVTIGSDCVVAPEAVLGSRGFGYIHDGKEHVRVPQVGCVEVGARSEIGPATCLDRAALEKTSVGENCEIGALVQIAHNCQIGDNCQIGFGTGLAGSTIIGSDSKLGIKVGTVGHSTFGSNVTLDDLCGMTKAKVASGSHWSGYPAHQIRD